MSEPAISRAGLVRAARLTIKDVRENGTEVPTSLVREVMKVARTATHVCALWRSEDDSCGCLIGTRYGRPSPSKREWASHREAKLQIGFAFPDHLCNAIGRRVRSNMSVEVVE